MSWNGWRAVLLLIVFASLTLNSCTRERSVEAAGDRAQPSIAETEQAFTQTATQAHLAEIDMARIAMEKSNNKDVSDYANMIRSDHGSALETLTDLMIDKHVPQVRTLAPQTQQDITRMTTLNGPEFDREFVNMMVSDHQKAISLFRDQQGISQNPDISKYVEGVLPTLELHLEKALRLQSRLFSSQAPRPRYK